MDNSNNLKITEIFYSIQGETKNVGLATVFIRLTGCPLRCNYCDTAYAFKGKNQLSIDDILNKVKQYNTKNICVTGGEPLAQNNCFDLLDILVLNDYDISLETSGSIDISKVNKKVCIVMDIKTPSSTESSKNRYENIKILTKKDQIKFVIANQDDFNWSCDILKKYDIKAEVLFSPVYESLKAVDLANWILAKELNVRLQIQLHKFLWGTEEGR